MSEPRQEIDPGCECTVHDDAPWVAVIVEDVSDDEGITQYHTVLGPFDNWEQASDAGHRYSYSIISPMIGPDDACDI